MSGNDIDLSKTIDENNFDFFARQKSRCEHTKYATHDTIRPHFVDYANTTFILNMWIMDIVWMATTQSFFFPFEFFVSCNNNRFLSAAISLLYLSV